MRNASILLAIIAFALVLSIAGDGGCAECLQGCCARSDGLRRLLSAVRRIILALGGAVETIARRLTAPFFWPLKRLLLLTPCLAEAAPLRI